MDSLLTTVAQILFPRSEPVAGAGKDALVRALASAAGEVGEPLSAWQPAAPQQLQQLQQLRRRRIAAGSSGSQASKDLDALVKAAAATVFSSPEAAHTVGFRELPPHEEWPDYTPERLVPTPPSALREHYDVVVVGAGAGGGVAAYVLAKAGLTVLVVERGRSLAPSALRTPHSGSARVYSGVPRAVDLAAGDAPRRVNGRFFAPGTPEWNGNAMTVGGGTHVYGAMAWRFSPEDFTMGSTYGEPFADWPITYEELAPYYDKVEWAMGVAGPAEPAAFDGPRSRPYPMPAVGLNRVGQALEAGARRIGLPTTAPPMLINTVEYDARPRCRRCGLCVGHACPIDAKSGTQNTLLRKAMLSGRAHLLDEAVATGLQTRGDRTVAGVTVVHQGSTLRVRARHVVLAAGAIETARLLLHARVGNDHDQVGRYLHGHLYAGATALFDEPVEDWIGPGPSIATTAYRHANASVPGGGILANEFTATPFEAWQKLTNAGFIDPSACDAVAALGSVYPRSAVVIGPVQEAPLPDSRVTLVRERRDRWGVPLTDLYSPGNHALDLKMASFLADRAADWLTASGATQVVHTEWAPSRGPSADQHQAGTCRMGNSPEKSVTDHRGRVWGWDGVTIADGSLHVTNGGVNPVLTILANSWRVAELLAADMSP